MPSSVAVTVCPLRIDGAQRYWQPPHARHQGAPRSPQHGPGDAASVYGVEGALRRLEQEVGSIHGSKESCLRALGALAAAAPSAASSDHRLADHPRVAELLAALSQHYREAAASLGAGAAGGAGGRFGAAATEATAPRVLLQELLRVTRHLLSLRLDLGQRPPGQGHRQDHRQGREPGSQGTGSQPGGNRAVPAMSAAVGMLLDGIAVTAAECLDALQRMEPGPGPEEAGGALPYAVQPTASARFVDEATGVPPGRAAAASAAVLLHNLVKLRCAAGGSMRRLAEAVATAAVRHDLAPALHSQAFQSLVWALGKLDASYHSLPPVRQLLEPLMARLAEPGLLAAMAPTGLSMVVYGMGKVGVPYGDPAVRRAVTGAVAAAAAAPDCGPQALSNMAWGLSQTMQPLLPPSPSPPPVASPSPASSHVATLPPQLSNRYGGSSSLHSGSIVSMANLPGSGGRPGGSPSRPVGVPHIDASVPMLRQALVALADAAVQQLDAFKPREAANLLGALAGLGALTDPRVAPLLAASRAYVSRRLHAMGPQDLAEVLYAYGTAAAAAAAGSDPEGEDDFAIPMPPAAGRTAAIPMEAERSADAEIAALLEGRCLKLLSGCPAYQVGTMLWGFAHLQASGHTPSRLLAAVSAALAGAREGQQDPVPAAAMPAPARAAEREQQHPRPRGAGQAPGEGRKQGEHQQQPVQVQGRVPDSCLRLELESSEALPASHLARLLWALARLGADVSPEGLRAVCGVIQRRLPEFDTQALLMSAWALATLGCPLHPSLEPLAGRLAALLPSMSPPQLSLALWSVAKLLDAAGGDLPGMAALRLFPASRGPLVAALPRLGPQRLAMVAWAYGTAGVHPGEAALAAVWERASALLAAAPRPGGEADVRQGRAWGSGGAVGARKGVSDQAVAMLGHAMAQLRCSNPRAVAAFAHAVVLRLAAAPPPPRVPSVAPASGRGPVVGHAGGLGSASGSGGAGDAVFLASVVCSLGRLHVRDGRLLQLACRRTAMLLPTLGPREAVQLLWGLGAMCSGVGGAGAAQGNGPGAANPNGHVDGVVPNGVWVCPPGFVSALARIAEGAICSQAIAEAQAKPRNASRSGGDDSAATAVPAPTPTHGSASQPQHLDGGLLSMFLLACVAHRHRPAPPVLQAACALLLRHLPSLASHTLCELTWAIATLAPPPASDVGVQVLLPLRRRASAPSEPQPEGSGAGASNPTTAAAVDPLWRAVKCLCRSDAKQAQALRRQRRSEAGRGPRQKGHSAAAAPELGSQAQPAAAQPETPNPPATATSAARVRPPSAAPQPHTRPLPSGELARAAGPLVVTVQKPRDGNTFAADSGPAVLTAARPTSPVVTGRMRELPLPPLWPVRFSLPEPLFRLPWRPAQRRAMSRQEATGQAVPPQQPGSAPGKQQRAPPALPLPEPSLPQRQLASSKPQQPPAPLSPPRLPATTHQQPTPTPMLAALAKPPAPPPRPKAQQTASTGPTPAKPPAPPAPVRQGTPAPAPANAQTSAAQPAAPAVPPTPPTAPPTPPAALVAPIYPRRAAQPAELAASYALLRRSLVLLAVRLCSKRAELLTLEPLVKVTWAMCVTRMYAPRLFRYCAVRAVTCPTRTLEPRPALLRTLVEARAMLVRQRPSTWRGLRLRTRWRRRMSGRDAGGAARWRLTPAEVLAAQPQEMVRQLLRCRAALEAAAEEAELPLEWRNTYEGERHGIMRLGRRSAFALVLLAPWQMSANEPAAAAAATAGTPVEAAAAAAAATSPLPLPLAGGAVTARLLRLRGWLVAGIHVEGWLALEPRERKEQLAALYGRMREAAHQRAAAAVAAVAAAAGAEASAVQHVAACAADPAATGAGDCDSGGQDAGRG